MCSDLTPPPPFSPPQTHMFGSHQSWARNNFLASRQRDNVTEPQGPEKIRKIVRPQCLHWVTAANIVKMQLLTYLWPENMVKLSRAQLW